MRNKNIMRVVAAILACIFFTTPVFAARPAPNFSLESYVYNRSGGHDNAFWVVPAPLPYRFSRTVTARDVGVASLNNIMEIKYHEGKFFITNGASLLVTDDNFQVLHEITGFYSGGEWQAFSPLNGIFITQDNEVYLAEPNAERVVHLDENFNLVRIIGRPEGIPIGDNILFQPIKVAVDHHGRIYIIANNVFQGIVELNADGTWNRYFGVVDVTYSALQLFRRSIQTQAQRARSALWIPQNFTNLTVDPDGFVFATISDAGTNVGVKKLNARGVNILRRPSEAQIVGDLRFTNFGIGIPMGPSVISIVDVTDFGVYYAFDSNRNRIFAYDEDGHLLFAFGGTGTRHGTTAAVTGMTIAGDRLVLADRGNSTIEVFERTVYGQAIMNAARRQFRSEYREAAEYWQEVLNFNPFFQYAYLGVGISLYRQGYFEEAMEYFRRSQDVTFFSQAYQRVRSANMYERFDLIMLSILIIALAAASLYIFRRVRAYRKERGLIT